MKTSKKKSLKGFKKVPGTKVHVPEHAIMPMKTPKKEIQLTHVGMEGFKNPTSGVNGFVLTWGTKEHGWGELTFKNVTKDRIECDSECMSKDFVEKVLNEFLNKVVIR